MMIIIGDKQIKHDVPCETAKDIKSMAQSKKWKEELNRLNNDPEYIAEKLKELDDEFDSQIENND